MLRLEVDVSKLAPAEEGGQRLAMQEARGLEVKGASGASMLGTAELCSGSQARL